MRTITLQLVAAPLIGQVVFSEVMFDLAGPDSPNEFVEIFNLSDRSVDLAGWLISDKSSTDELLDLGRGTTLLPFSYCVILEGDYEIGDGLYDAVIPDSVLILTVDDNSIGNQLSVSDSLTLIDSDSTVIDSLGWSQIASPGFSLERLFLDRQSTWDNWALSKDSLGTPGLPNSVTPVAVDLGIFALGISHTPHYPEQGQNLMIRVPVIGYGTDTTTAILSVSSESVELANSETPPISYGDTVMVSLEIEGLPSGISQVTATVSAEGDGDSFNDTVLYEIRVRFGEGVIMFNEILYAPDESVPEFVEVVNVSANIIDLNGWSLADADSSRKRSLTPLELWPEEHLVFASDSAIQFSSGGILTVPKGGLPALNNSGDTVYLFDMSGRIIDSLSFTSDWGGGGGRSLEKLNPSFPSHLREWWGTCVSPDKMTAGGRNSIYMESLPPAGTLTLSPNPFSPDNDGHEDILYISYHLPFPKGLVTVNVFDIVGRMIVSLAKNQSSSSEGVLTWDGRRDGGERAKIGLYILKFVAVESESGRQTEWIDTVVLAEPLR